RVPAGAPENRPARADPQPACRGARSAAWADGLVEVLEERSYAEGDVLRFIPLSEVLG
ncbi:MAG: molybdopterin molybdenumtransferase MoeA, partial [Aquipseudomonas alcaligenes]